MPIVTRFHVKQEFSEWEFLAAYISNVFDVCYVKVDISAYCFYCFREARNC